MPNEKCPICNIVNPSTDLIEERDGYFCRCRVCGEYKITVPAYKDFIEPEKHKDYRYILSGYIRKAFEENRKTPEISLDNYQEIIDSTDLPSDIEDYLENIMNYISKKTKVYGEFVHLNFREYPVFFAKGLIEFSYFLEKLIELGYLELESSYGSYAKVKKEGGDFCDMSYRLTLKGIEKYKEIKKRGKDSRQIFIAMWFDDSKKYNDTNLKNAYLEGIKPAIELTGHKTMRLDYIEHNDFIVDKIISEIKRSRAMVADITGNRGGVYFEAGFAMGLSIPVIWTCHETDFDKRHFDVKQVNTIKWKNPDDLKENLINRIEATIGKLN